MRSRRSRTTQDPRGSRTRRRLHVVRALLIAFLFSLLASEQADAARRGILGQPAPPLWANAWFNLPGNTGPVDLEAYRGQVVYLLFFQSWCPGCHRHGFPTLKKVRDHYAARGDVIFIAVQTVFEGFHTNDEAAARRTMAQFELEIPFGHDAGPDQGGSLTMPRYRAGGTPWTVIVDREGVVRFNGFHIKPGEAVKQIDRLLAMH